jgi:hypothetical protein
MNIVVKSFVVFACWAVALFFGSSFYIVAKSLRDNWEHIDLHIFPFASAILAMLLILTLGFLVFPWIKFDD